MSDLPPPSFDPPHVPAPGGPTPPSPAGFAPPVPGMPAAPAPVAAAAVPTPSRGVPTKFWVIGGVLSALVAAAVLVVSLRGDDGPSAGADTTSVSDTTDAADDTAVPATEAVTTTEPAPTTTEAAPTTTGSPLTLPSTVVPAAPTVDLGNGVSFALPDGYTQESVNNGIEITDGTVRLFAQVSSRTPGDDPLAFAQEYIDSFESTFEAASFSQAIPAGADTTGLAPSDGYFIYYRVMNTDQTGFKGLIDATRRADGLVYLTDVYSALDTDGTDALPDGLYDEFYSSYLSAPLLGPTVELPALALSRPSSTHPSFAIDGVVAMSPPPGWTVEQPGPQRVAFAKPDGQRFAAGRLADTADPLVAQDLAFAGLQVVLPGATIGGFTASREGEPVISFDSTVAATDAGGRAIEGVVRVWVDTVRSQVFAAVSYNFADTPPSLVEEDFLVGALDLSLTDDH